MGRSIGDRVRALAGGRTTYFRRITNLPPDYHVLPRLVGPVRPLPSFRLNALVATWLEADVVGATVANAFAQGCDAVYLLDNNSPDDTVAVAEAAGAELLERWGADHYDEPERLRRMNDWVDRISRRSGEPHVWWLYLDADEFPRGRHGLTIGEQLAGLDRSIRVVGASTWNHYPGAAPQYEPGRHPIDFQPRCERHVEPYCIQGHHKHPLLRWDADRPQIRAGVGFHRVVPPPGTPVLFEPQGGIVSHHFQYRDETFTKDRIRASAARTTANMPILKRVERLDAIYANDWDHVLLRRGRLGNRPVRPLPYAEVLPDTDASLRRWY